jgi:hypothetical protein
MRFGAFLAGLALLALLGHSCVPAPLQAADKDKEGFVDLFNGKDLTGFKAFPDKDVDKTWSVKEGIILCTGKPNGYLYTDKSFKNYVLLYDWKYVRPKDLTDEEKFLGNSGCLVHITGNHVVWPKCVEVQGMNRDHGKLLFVNKAGGKEEFFKRDDLKKVRKPVGEWNTTEILCKDGMISAKVNGTEISKGTTDLTDGPIGWQSEGAEIHFKNIKIKELK